MSSESLRTEQIRVHHPMETLDTTASLMFHGRPKQTSSHSIMSYKERCTYFGGVCTCSRDAKYISSITSYFNMSNSLIKDHVINQLDPVSKMYLIITKQLGVVTLTPECIKVLLFRKLLPWHPK